MANIVIHNFDSIDVIQINRKSGKGNALNTDTLEELRNSLREIKQNDEANGLILTGTGNFFSSGLDLNELANLLPSEIKNYLNLSSSVFLELFGLSIPTIAAINGHAVAGGAVLACACDFRLFMKGNFKFGFTGVNLGIPYPLIPLEIIKFAIPSYSYSEILLEGKLIDPETALQKNIVQILIDSSSDIIEEAITYMKDNIKAPRKNYKFLKDNLRKPIIDYIKKIKDEYDKNLFEKFLSNDLNNILNEKLHKYK
ncbi:MAG: enoyl-CoA hydratase/isomerase family protein [Candidatus Thorarchaeota archaeon]